MKTLKLETKNKPCKVCGICNMEILDKEHFAKLETFLNQKSEGEWYYHVTCFRDRFMVPNNKLNTLLDNMNKIVGRIS